jgi:hypothetical protein
MQGSMRSSRGFTIAWLVLAAALCAVIALWGVQIANALGHAGRTVAAISLPHTTPTPAAPPIITVYTTDHTGRAGWLCTELSPGTTTIRVETPTGEIISTLHCPNQ